MKKKNNNKITLKGGYVSVATMSSSEFGEHIKRLSSMSGTHKNKKRIEKDRRMKNEIRKYCA